MLELSLSLAFDLLVAALVGLAVGVEREWSGHTAGPDARFGGARTFAILGVLGGFAGWFFRLDQPLAGAVALGGGMLFVLLAYHSAMQRSGTTLDSTTEAAALLVIVLGVTAGLGFRATASAAAAVVVVLLAEKSQLQQVLTKIAPAEMRAAFHFAVLALVVLPLIPDRSFGPYGAIQPRQLWVVVLAFSALNFAGYVARRAIGETRGLAVTGLLGGLVSSTAVTLAFSRRSRLATASNEPQAMPLALGVVAACTVLVPRVLVIAAVLEQSVGMSALPVLGPAFITGIAIVAAVLRRNAPSEYSSHEGNSESEVIHDGNPLGLWSALQMAAVFQMVLLAVAWVNNTTDGTGILASAAVLGFTNMDALTLSMARLGSDPDSASIAALAIGIGVLSNTMLKLIIALLFGAPRFRVLVTQGLLLLAVALALGIFLGWP